MNAEELKKAKVLKALWKQCRFQSDLQVAVYQTQKKGTINNGH
jgi:hypothetical protein